MPVDSRDLQKKIEEIFDFAYTNSNIRVPAKTCKEVGKLLHVGMFIEEVEGQIPAYQFSTEELKKLDGNLHSHAEKLSTDVRKKFKKMNKAWKIYAESEIEFDDKCIPYIIGKLNHLYISDPDRDVFGDALEIFRSRWAKQEGGQFFTDQRVTSLAIKLLQFNPYNGDDLVDICAGTGGFLLAGFNRIKELVDDVGGTEKDVLSLAAKSLKGQEVDTEVANLGNSTLVARTGNYVDRLIQTGNSLDGNTFEKQNNISFGKHSCAATNPPFGAKITIKDLQLLKHYELAKFTNTNVIQSNYSSSKLYKRAPDILFVEQNIRLLKPGEGRLAIVVPYQIISGPQTLYVRDWLIRNAQITAVIDLPGETFQPHTGTKTALVVLKRRPKPLLNTAAAKKENVFMATPRWIGHDRRGNPIYKKNPDGTDSAEILSDFSDVENALDAYLDGKDPVKTYSECFVVSGKEILGDELLRLNASFYREVNKKGNKELDPKKWEIKPISEFVERIFYPGRFKRNYVDRYDGAIPFLGGSNITQLVISTEKWLRHDDPKLDQLSIKAGWLLVTRSGTTGIVSSVPKIWDGFAMSEHVIRIVPDKSKLSPDYLLAFLKTEYCQKQIAKGVFGSVIDEITPESIGQIKIPIPKDKSAYKDICTKIAKSERAKQTALDNLYGAVDQLGGLLPD